MYKVKREKIEDHEGYLIKGWKWPCPVCGEETHGYPKDGETLSDIMADGRCYPCRRSVLKEKGNG